LSLEARLENVRGVFEVTSPGCIRNRVAILVDDVFTTGATLSSCATALKLAGAQRVLALTLARATPQTLDKVILAPALPVDEPRNERT
jgi:predicted amidophosphoribosyltransferase